MDWLPCRKWFNGLLCAAAILLALPLAQAEETNNKSNTQDWDSIPVLEEVIVTARKRQEAMQDTPVAVSALTADKLKAAGISNTRDLQKSVPGLIFAELGNKSPAIFIRGIGQKESIAALDPGVGVYINGIYISRTDTQLLDTVDTQSVQVLRGPQGTLFGKNNTGGALLITTQQPHVENFSSELTTRIGNFGRKDLKYSANIPLNSETLSMRVGLNSTKRDGYLRSYVDPKGVDFGDEERLGATGRLFWQNSDVMSSDLFFYWSKQNERGSGFTCIYQNADGVFDTLRVPGFEGDESYDDRCRLSEKLADDDEVLINGPTRFTMTNQILALTLNWEFEDIEVKSITAWSHQKDIVIIDDNDATDLSGVSGGTYALLKTLDNSLANGYGNFKTPDAERRDQYSQELQLIGSAFDESLSYTVGIFAAKEKITDNIYSQLVGHNGYSYREDLGVLLPKLLGAVSDMSNETYAAFGQFTYDITDYYQFTLGLRYTVEIRERQARLFEADCEKIHEDAVVPGTTTSVLCSEETLPLPDPSGFYDNPPDFLPIRTVDVYTTPDLIPDTDPPEYRTITAVNGWTADEEEWRRWTPTLTNSFNVPEEWLENTNLNSTLLYFTYSKGFKSGGFEMRGLEIFKFDPEILINREVGLKIDALEDRLRFNTALYYMSYEDIQVRITEQGRTFADILLYIDNAGSATFKGIEMELTALPLPYLTLQLTANYTDASYDRFIASTVDTSALPPVSSIVDRSDEDFAAVPKFTYSITTILTLATEQGFFIPRLTLYYRDELFTGLDSTAGQARFKDRTYIPEVYLLSARLAYIPHFTENFDITFFVDNIADKDYFQGGLSNTDSLGAGTWVKGMPRHYGFEASLRF